MTAQVASPSAALARALAARLRDAAAAADRLASFSFDGPLGPEPPESTLRAGEEAATAGDFVLRVLNGASDPVNHRLLVTVNGEGTTLTGLAAHLGLPRLAVIERVAELTQLGLVGRELATDTVMASPAGSALLALVDELSAGTAQWLERRRS